MAVMSVLGNTKRNKGIQDEDVSLGLILLKAALITDGDGTPNH